MQTAVINIDGRDFFAVFNTAVLSRMEDLGMKIEDIRSGDRPVSTIMRMLSLMIESGSAYAARKGLGEYPAISYEELLLVADLQDVSRLQPTVEQLIIGDRKVDAEPPKKPAGDAEAALTN